MCIHFALCSAKYANHFLIHGLEKYSIMVVDLLLLLLFFLIEFNYKMLMRKIALEKQFTFSLGRHVVQVNAQTVSMPMAQ